MSNPPEFVLRKMAENKRIDEIKKIVNRELEIVYPENFALPINHPSRILTTWWLYELWSDKKNNRNIRYPDKFQFAKKNFDKIKFHPKGSYEDYLD